MPKYLPRDSFVTPRFCGVRTFMRLPHVEDLAPDMDFAIIGIPFDGGQSYRSGARFGPEAIRDASILLRPFNAEQKITIFDYISGVDYGDCPVVPGYIEETYKKTEITLRLAADLGIIPVVLGGDHCITLAELRALHQCHGPLGLVHFDAHSDTWDAYFEQKYNHGTTFRRAVEEGLLDPARVIQVGMRGPLYGADDLNAARELGFEVYTTSDLRRIGFKNMVEKIKARVLPGPVFLSFDIDFVDPAFAPGTGTPEVGGVTSWEALELVRGLRGIPFVGFDLVEVLPSYDHAQVTSLLAANIVYEFLTLIAIAKQERSVCTPCPSIPSA
ncbi:agmatinase [Alicyclobacillus mali (ex Roth et al. 2021)]|uniref:agmatinase n=1 Tax=Alicyclobacillus mali (ex Roth et al. 2021) TaxID=1123961 RepID=UPI00324258F4